MVCALGYVNAQGQICAQIGEFNACVNTANLKIAGCSAAVKDVPDIKYYECQCVGYKESLACGFLCLDDPNIQLQLRTVEPNVNSVCSAVDMMKQQGRDKTTTTTAKTTSTPRITRTATNSNSASKPTSSVESGGNVVEETLEPTPTPTETPFPGLSTSGTGKLVTLGNVWMSLVALLMYFII